MQIHGSCAEHSGLGVLLVGLPGSGKSDLLLRLLDRGFSLVADDRVDIEPEGCIARPPAALAGLLEIRGFGIVRLPHVAVCRLALVVDLSATVPRLPAPARHRVLDLPMIGLDPRSASAPARIGVALDCLRGATEQMVGALVE
jgi:HPr kinase/phosphorylase